MMIRIVQDIHISIGKLSVLFIRLIQYFPTLCNTCIKNTFHEPKAPNQWWINGYEKSKFIT